MNLGIARRRHPEDPESPFVLVCSIQGSRQPAGDLLSNGPPQAYEDERSIRFHSLEDLERRLDPGAERESELGGSGRRS